MQCQTFWRNQEEGGVGLRNGVGSKQQEQCHPTGEVGKDNGESKEELMLYCKMLGVMALSVWRGNHYLLYTILSACYIETDVFSIARDTFYK